MTLNFPFCTWQKCWQPLYIFSFALYLINWSFSTQNFPWSGSFHSYFCMIGTCVVKHEMISHHICMFMSKIKILSASLMKCHTEIRESVYTNWLKYIKFIKLFFKMQVIIHPPCYSIREEDAYCLKHFLMMSLFIWETWHDHAWFSTSSVWKLLKSPKKGLLVFVTGVVMCSEARLYMQLESLNKYFRAKLKT